MQKRERVPRQWLACLVCGAGFLADHKGRVTCSWHCAGVWRSDKYRSDRLQHEVVRAESGNAGSSVGESEREPGIALPVITIER